MGRGGGLEDVGEGFDGHQEGVPLPAPFSPLIGSVMAPPSQVSSSSGAVGAEIALVIIALAAFMVVVVVYASRQKLESQKHNLEAAVKRATRPVAPRLKVPVFKRPKRRRRR